MKRADQLKVLENTVRTPRSHDQALTYGPKCYIDI